jgi:hypothetical protein
MIYSEQHVIAFLQGSSLFFSGMFLNNLLGLPFKALQDDLEDCLFVANGIYVQIQLIQYQHQSPHYSRIPDNNVPTPGHIVLSRIKIFPNNQGSMLSNGEILPHELSGLFRKYRFKAFFDSVVWHNQLGFYHSTQDILNLVRVCSVENNCFLLNDDVSPDLLDAQVVYDFFNGDEFRISCFFRHLIPSMKRLFNRRIALRSLSLRNVFAESSPSRVRIRYFEDDEIQESDENANQWPILKNIRTLAVMAAQLYLNNPVIEEEEILPELEAADHLSPHTKAFVRDLMSFDEHKVFNEQYDLLDAIVNGL